MKALVNFLFEAGMLKETPRTGYQFLGTGQESVAEHSFRTAIIGYILSREEEADVLRTILMCLFHDIHEARTGDQNYVNKQYNHVNEGKAIGDMAHGLPFGEHIVSLTREYKLGESLEARVSRDADQLDLILELKKHRDLGNPYAVEWLSYAVKRLVTEKAKEMAQEILNTDWTEWWFEKKTELWVNAPNADKRDK